MHIRLVLALFVLGLAAGCSLEEERSESGDGARSRDAAGLETLIEGLNNPSHVSFSPDGKLTVCSAGPGRDGGNGRVIVWRNNAHSDFITGFPTQYWKPGKEGAPDRFKLGPLSAVWTTDDELVVSNSGLADGVDHLLVFAGGGDAKEGEPTNAVPPTSDDEADNGEGNFTGLSLAADGKSVYVCGQGADAKSWLLACDVAERKLQGFASADDNGITVNSPMDSLAWGTDAVLVLYSGAGGKEDGLLVLWDLATRKPVTRWTLPGVFDPMGMARVPGSDDLVVVDNNWDLTSVKQGRLARISLTEDGGAAEVTMIREDLPGPTSCAFGPNGRLFVSLLGPEFDKDLGSVVAISGIR